MIGPAGSGTLSLVRGLAALTESRARKFLFDWEVELEAQQRLLNDLATRSLADAEEEEVWVLRKIHLLGEGELAKLVPALRSLQESNTNTVICYATSEPGFQSTASSRELAGLFAVHITLGDGGYARGAFDSILASALAMLRRKYGNRVSRIEPEAVRMLENIALQEKLPAMLTSLERAFVVESEASLRVSTLLGGKRVEPVS